MPLPLAPHATIEADFVRSLIFRRPPPPRWAGDLRDLLKPIGPGVYVAHFEASAPAGRKLISNKFEFTVMEAQGADAKARDRIGKEHWDFFEGRDRPPDSSYYHGGKWWKKVDISRFQELQKILDDYPDSEYAQWIRFWKLYHHGPVDDALQYARDHPHFPLCDNLMLHMADGLFSIGQYARARTVITELANRFPDGDTRAARLDLKKKLTRKP